MDVTSGEVDQTFHGCLHLDFLGCIGKWYKWNEERLCKHVCNELLQVMVSALAEVKARKIYPHAKRFIDL